jgi:hypothetical protein
MKIGEDSCWRVQVLVCSSVLECNEQASGHNHLYVALIVLNRIPQSGMIERTEQ